MYSQLLHDFDFIQVSQFLGFVVVVVVFKMQVFSFFILLSAFILMTTLKSCKIRLGIIRNLGAACNYYVTSIVNSWGLGCWLG